MAFPGQQFGSGHLDPITAACCGRSYGGDSSYPPQAFGKRPPDAGFSPQVSREEVENWCVMKFQELSKSLEASLTNKYLTSFSNFEGRLGMMEHTQRVTAHERKSQQPMPMINSADLVKDEHSELLSARVAMVENRIKEMQVPIAILQDRADQPAIMEDRPAEREVQKEGALQDEQVIATIARRIEMGETTMARIEDIARSCSNEVSRLQTSVDHLDKHREDLRASVDQLEKGRTDQSLPAFGGILNLSNDAANEKFLPAAPVVPRTHMLSPEPTREHTDLLSDGFDVKGQLRELKAIVSDLESQMRTGPSSKYESKLKGFEGKEGVQSSNVGAGVQMQSIDIDEEASKLKPILTPSPTGLSTTSKEVELSEDELAAFADAGYALENNIWDASIFIGHQLLGADDSAALAFLLVLNVAVQFVFCILATMVFTDPSFGEMQIAGFNAWRTDIAGRWDYREQISGMSLGRRVCEEDSHHWGLELSTTQAQAVLMLREYLGAGDGFPTGIVMCTVALFCWFVSLTSELRLAIQCLSSCAQIPVGPMRISKSVKSGRIGMRISSMNMGRFMFITTVCAMRVGIVSMLAYVGTKYVVYEEEVGEMLVNAVALHFVLDIDELLFSLVPAPAKGLIADLEALPPPRCFQRGPFKLRWHQAVSVTGLLIMICWALPSVVKNDFDNRQTALDVLCEGNKDFVYGLDRMGVLNWAKTKSTAAQDDAIMRKALRSIIKLDGTTLPTSDVIDGAAFSLKAMLEQSSSHAAGRHNSICVDVQEITNRPASVIRLYEGILADALQSAEHLQIAGCTGVEAHCNVNSPTGTHLRQLCPRTCGCRSAESWNPLAYPRYGCPSSCSMLVNYSSGRNCTEVPKAKLILDETWTSFANHLNRTLQLLTLDLYEKAAQDALRSIPKYMLQEGCDVVKREQELARHGFVLDFCQAEGSMSFFKSIRIWCPETCKCSRDVPECPRDCPSHFDVAHR